MTPSLRVRTGGYGAMNPATEDRLTRRPDKRAIRGGKGDYYPRSAVIVEGHLEDKSEAASGIRYTREGSMNVVLPKTYICPVSDN